MARNNNRNDYTSEEIKAIYRKSDNPKLAVKCPRCGAMLVYSESASAYEVHCPTEGCIRNVWRGI